MITNALPPFLWFTVYSFPVPVAYQGRLQGMGFLVTQVVYQKSLKENVMARRGWTNFTYG